MLRCSKRALAILSLSALAFTSTGSVCAAKETPGWWDQRIKNGVSAYELGENRAAYIIFSKLLVDGNRTFGSSDGRMSRVYANLGAVYDAQHEYRFAESCLKRALDIARKGYGAKSAPCVTPLINLAQTYVHEGKYAQAQPLFTDALSIADKSGDTTMLPYAAVAEADLGSLFYAEGKNAFAAPHFQRAFELSTKSLGAAHKWTVTIGAMYAACLQALGRSTEAKAVERAAIAKANESESPVTTWNKQIGIADEAITAKQFTAAETALKLALQASQQVSSEPMLQSVVLIRYGQVLLWQNKPVQAIEKWKAAQAIADSALGTYDPAVLNRAKVLADLERSQEHYADAEPLYARIVRSAKKQFGSDSDQYVTALTDLADLHMRWAEYPKAILNYSTLLSLHEKKYGKDSEKLIPDLMALGEAQENNPVYFAEPNDSGEQYFKRASQIAIGHFGKNSKELTPILESLIHYYQLQFDWNKAAQTCTEVVAADEKNFGAESPQTVKALERYAAILRAGGWRDKAEPVEARIAKIKGLGSEPADQ